MGRRRTVRGISFPKASDAHARRFRRLLVLKTIGSLIVLLLVAELMPLSPGLGLRPTAEAAEGRGAPPGAPPAPPGHADRRPVLAEFEEAGVRNPRESIPGGGAVVLGPGQGVKGLSRLPERGGPNFDIFGVGAARAEHVARIYSADVNFQDADGNWKKKTLAVASDSYGWKGSSGDAGVYLPKALAASTPVRLEIPQGALSASPSGLPSGGVAGSSDGSSITYKDALPSTDLVYRVSLHGYKELVVLKDAAAPSSLSYNLKVTGLQLRMGPGGALEVLSGADVVGSIPPALVYDSSPQPQETVAPYDLADLGDGAYRVDLAVDPAYLATAAYPVRIDPGFAKRHPSRDTYVNRNYPNTAYGGSDYLRVGSGYYTFIRFDTSALQKNNRIVYDAPLYLWNVSQNDKSVAVKARRVTEGWPSTLTWNNQPAASTAVYASETGGTKTWFKWQLKALYQRYLDNTWSDYGARLGSGDYKVFYSDEAGGDARPLLAVSFNDLPNDPVLAVPDGGASIQTESPTLKLDRIPGDPNGDEVLVRFQISDDKDNFTGSHLQWSSPWIDERAYVVPAGVLTDGETYYWRAQSWDVCKEPDSMCSRTDGAGNVHPLPTSSVRKFTVSLKHLGDDERWAMSSYELGNDIALKVNQSNGNAYLDVPLDSLVTPVGDLEVALSYNSQQGADFGLGRGWDIAAGPGSSARELPVKLKELDPAPDSGIQIRFRDGSMRHFPHKTRRIYAAVGSGADVVKKNGDDTFTYTTASGGTYTFGASGNLRRAKPATATAAAGGNGFDYVFNASDHITKVTDPLGRAVSFSWSGSPERLDSITAWDGRTWVIAYDSLGRAAAVTDPEKATVAFSYNGDGLLSAVRNGEAYDKGRPGWAIAYWTDTLQNDPGQTKRVDTITAPGAASSWDYDYKPPYKGATAAQAWVTDPRGTATTNVENDFQTRTHFNWAGLPIRTDGPADQTGYWPITTMVWDSHHNLLCSRDPAANARALGCTASDTSDPLSTEYRYDIRAPHRLKSVTHPAPNADGTGERAKESHAYDAGYDGLWVEMFENGSLSGTPKHETIYRSMSPSWGAGSPAGLSGSDYWSLRLTGLLHTDTTTAKKFRFRFYSDDGITVAVGNDTLVDCFGQTNAYSDYNCGTKTDVVKKLWPGARTITVEFQERTGDAAFALKWDQGNGNWETIPAAAFTPHIGLVTTTTMPKLEVGYDYPSTDHKARRLAAAKTATDRATGEPRKTTFTYDAYGRVLTTIEAPGTTAEAKTTNTYSDDATAKTSCLARIQDPTGALVEQSCNPAGDVVEVKEHIRAAGLQDAHTRITTTTYDKLGRVVKEDPPGDGVTTTSYDKAGRAKTVDVLLDAGTGTHAVTSYSYNDAGELVAEVLPDPDGSGPQASPVVRYGYDATGNQISESDPRNEQWLGKTGYDAANRAISTTTPSGLRATTTYRLKTGPTTSDTYVNDVTTIDPAGVRTVTKLDVLARKMSQQTGSLNAESYAYDVVGNVVKATDPAGVVTEQTYNAFSEVVKTITPHSATTSSVTTNSYDPAGNLVRVDGPRDDVNDARDYSYDKGGRLTAVTQPGLPAPNTTRFSYNDAGERIEVRQPLSDTRDLVRSYIYSPAGRLVTYKDAKGTTTYRYNAPGWLTSVEDPRGITLRYDYDNLGRQTRRYAVAPDGLGGTTTKDSESFAYDLAGNMTEATNATATVTFAYDSDGRTTSVSQGSAATTYSYDPATGYLSSLATPAGTTAYSYEQNGLLAALTDPFTGKPTSYSYDAAGRPTSRSDPAGVTWQRAYDASGRLSSQTISSATGSVASFELAYDKAGNVISRKQDVAGNDDSGTWSYTYDPAGRLTSATDPKGIATAYGYDSASNRSSVKVGTDAAVTTAYDDAGLPTTSSDGTTYSHDAAGNMTAIKGDKRAWAYIYDSWGRMTKAERTLKSIAYAHDALDRTVTRTSALDNTSFYYVGDSEEPARVVADTGGLAATETLYAYSPGGPLAQKQGSDVRFFLSDLHGDVIGMTDAVGATTGTTSYSPWGEVRAKTGESAYFGFQGDPTDQDTGLVDMLTRNYDPTLGRFTSRDILFGEADQPASLNQYVYGVDNPVTMIDPDGMRPIASGQAPRGSSSGVSRSSRHRASYPSYIYNYPSARTYSRDFLSARTHRSYVPPRPRPARGPRLLTISAGGANDAFTAGREGSNARPPRRWEGECNSWGGQKACPRPYVASRVHVRARFDRWREAGVRAVGAGTGCRQVPPVPPWLKGACYAGAGVYASERLVEFSLKRGVWDWNCDHGVLERRVRVGWNAPSYLSRRLIVPNYCD